MSMWEKSLSRDNIDEFFHLFASPAFRSAYRILGDTTRTESALTEAFIEVYQQRNSDNAGDLVFLFSDILQRRAEELALKYPVSETKSTANRLLDEFTENAILSEIHHRIDSKPYKILEIITSSVGKTNMRADPVLGQISKSGISLFLIFQLLIVAILVFVITFASAKTVFGIDDLAPKSPENAELSVEDLLVPILNYLPLSVSGTTMTADMDQTNPDSGSIEPEQGITGSDTSSQGSSLESTVASATRG